MFNIFELTYKIEEPEIIATMTTYFSNKKAVEDFIEKYNVVVYDRKEHQVKESVDEIID